MVACKSCGLYSAGQLQSKITIQRKTRASDGMGGVTESWAVEATPWAMWRALSGSELWAAMRINPMVKVKAVIRFKGDAYGAPYYTPGDRVTYRNREYAIIAVLDPDDRQEWLEMMLAEGSPS
jgi:SPP1 family predicted phage head-tail adaptor